MNSSRLNPYFALWFGVVSLSTSAILVKFSTAPSGVIAFYRLLFSVIFMLPLFLHQYIPELKRISFKDWIHTIIAGVFLAFHFILWFESLNYTSVASSTVLVTLQPIFAFVGSYFIFHERFSNKAIFSCVITILGSVLISWGDFYVSGTALYGDILALIACSLVTFYFMFGQSVRKRVSLITYTFVVYSISSIVLFLYVVIRGEPLLPYNSFNWTMFILLAIFPTLLGHSIINWSLKWLKASTVSMAIVFEPVGSAIMAYFFFQENVIWTQVLGGLIVLGGIMLFSMDERKMKNENKMRLD
jgi:drug/metabolite transporter (DMT)-like permease